MIRKDSATYYLLQALIPYSEANLRLAFKPHSFFNELERRDRMSRRALQTAWDRSVAKGYISLDDHKLPRLTPEGRAQLAPFIAKKLPGAQLMAVFDIPEVERWKRRQLRATLKEFSFQQIQRSVWVTDKDCLTYVQSTIKQLSLEHDVRLFEAKVVN